MMGMQTSRPFLTSRAHAPAARTARMLGAQNSREGTSLARAGFSYLGFTRLGGSFVYTPPNGRLLHITENRGILSHETKKSIQKE